MVMTTKYDANSEIAIAETIIKFPEEGLSASARVVLSLSRLPDIRFEFQEITPRLHEILFKWQLEMDRTLTVDLGTGEHLDMKVFGDSLVPIDGLVTGLDTTELLHSVRFGLVNFPDYMNSGFLAPYEDEDGRRGFRVGRTIQLGGAPWLVEVTPVKNHKEVHASLRQQGGFGLTHWGSINRADASSFSRESVQSLITALTLFFSFARGLHCGLTLVTGFNQADEKVWEQWGVSNVESWRGHQSWFDTLNGKILEDVFPGFWTQYQSLAIDDRKRLALEWYLDSNAQKALHSSIVLTQAALERLSYETVGARLRRGQSGRKDDEKEGEWIARALYNIGAVSKIPPACVQLEQFRKTNRLKHGPHAIVEIRDDLIHHKMEYGVLSGDIYHEARELGLWYVEMLLLKLFDYQGEYSNRLTQKWRGQVELVPWAQTSTGIQ